MIATPTLTTPVLIDAALSHLTSKLLNLKWLDNSFGKVERLKDGAKTFPAIYVSRKNKLEYIKLFPDAELGNFSYIDVYDPINIQQIPREYSVIDFECGVVFWFDYRKIYEKDSELHTLENVKAEVLDLINRSTYPEIHIDILRFKDRTENVYNGFTIKEIENQYNMRPYGCFKIELKVTYKRHC